MTRDPMPSRPSRRLQWARLLPYLLLLELTACALAPPSPPLPPVATLPTAAPEAYRLTFERDDQHRELIAVLRHDHQALRLALLSPQGQRLLTLVQDADGARFLPDAAFEPPFSADWLASRLSWGLWPADRLRAAFAGSDWRLETRDQTRVIHHGDRRVARLEGDTECRVLHDREGGYRLSIVPLDTQDQARDPCRAP
ncbi:DUF3261 domain-containing protein [Halomonas ramblicola]|uniref:DUF3261 domain-containing protein n=1 Tax=Halomonas ramblicola TaxID=747349 RepID=UPI0025B424DF|nr:DUF3261 domain-containing protein [Halomonas ramblicola]MDN3521799.1 DUF3261 domain-containing protein [Halomonas ramblicola]